MKLTYRGISYEYNPPAVEVTEGTPVGKYRGLDWRFRNLKADPVLTPTHNLTYRGVEYCTNLTASSDNVTSDTANTAKPVVKVSELARYRTMAHTQAIKKREQSMLNRLAAQVGLDTNKWKFSNHIQGKIHPTFRLNYERASASFS